MDELEAVPGLEEGIALISRLKTVWENTLQQSSYPTGSVPDLTRVQKTRS
jgi:hypothetical protein